MARVAVDVNLAHLDRPFDFLVPESLAVAAAPGVRVRVRFAGRLVNGYLLERVEASGHPGALAFLDRVVSAEQVLTPEVSVLARQVADRYAGTLADVLRLAIPPRHGRTEDAEPKPGDIATDALSAPDRPAAAGWARYDHGQALLDAVHAGGPVRAVWSALPGPRWPEEIAWLVGSALAGGRGSLVVLPDQRDVARVDAALTALIGEGRHVVLSAAPGPAERYRRWLQVLRGEVRAVVGTRAAMFAPVRDLGLLVVWDDGDDLHAEPRAPYPHVRTVLALRSTRTAASLVVGGLSRTAEGAAMVRSGWARSVTAPRDTVRRSAPTVVVADVTDESADQGITGARVPRAVWRTARAALERGPVLVSVPRGGYLPTLACAACRSPARCPACHGPLGIVGAGDTAAAHGPGGAATEATAPGRHRSADGARGDGADAAVPSCRWCGVPAVAWTCHACGGRRLRAVVVGSGRTAEELGRAFPRVRVRSSGGGHRVIGAVGAQPALVVATPGAEPVAEGGYAAGILLDSWALLGRPDLRAAEEALRRWTAVAALVRSGGDGGTVVLSADAVVPAVQALVRWDQAGFAERELDERAALRLPPHARMASLTGSPDAVAALLAAADLPPAAELLGPVPAGEDRGGSEPLTRMLVRAPGPVWAATVAALKAGAGVRSAHKERGSVRIQVDPLEIA